MPQDIPVLAFDLTDPAEPDNTVFVTGAPMRRFTFQKASLAFALLVLLSACDSGSAEPDFDVTRPASAGALDPSPFAVQSTDGPITGVWSGVVTSATDPNQASFGRDPARWVGKPVTGTFAIFHTTDGIVDHDGSPDRWSLFPSPGPGPFIEFVALTADIDGQAFATSSSDFHTVFFGDVVLIETSASTQSFRPQDSFVGAGTGGTGRTVLGFDAFFAPGGITFDGVTLGLDGSRLTSGQGIIDDLLESGGVPSRHGSIVFNLTSLKVSPIGALKQPINRLTSTGALRARQANLLRWHVDRVDRHWTAGRRPAACAQLLPMMGEVRLFQLQGSLSDGSALELGAGIRWAAADMFCRFGDRLWPPRP